MTQISLSVKQVHRYKEQIVVVEGNAGREEWSLGLADANYYT